MKTLTMLPGARNSQTTLQVVVDGVSLALVPAVPGTGLSEKPSRVSGVGIGPWEGVRMALPQD